MSLQRNEFDKKNKLGLSNTLSGLHGELINVSLYMNHADERSGKYLSYYTRRNYNIQIWPDLKKNLYCEYRPSVSSVLTLIPGVFRIRNGMLFTENFALVYAKNYANPARD